MPRKEKPITDGGFKKMKKDTRAKVKKEYKTLEFAKKFKAKRKAKKAFHDSYKTGSWDTYNTN